MLAKVVLLSLCASLTRAAELASIDESEGSCTNFVQFQASLKHVMRPKVQWEEPLSPEEANEFEKDMRMPIKQWLRENPDLNSDYFVKFGMNRGYIELMFWQGVHNITDYVEGGKYGANMWKTWPDYLGEGKGPSKTWTMESSTVTSRHLDSRSYLPDDAYCWTFGWLKGQGLDGSLMSDRSAWEALNAQECNKIGVALAVDFPEENHTVYRHVMWNRVWPEGLQCNVVGASCIPMTKNNLREHVYRKCLLGFAPSEMAYCYTRGCLINGNEIGHGPECK